MKKREKQPKPPKEPKKPLKCSVFNISVWSRCSAVLIYYAVFFVVFHLLFWCFFDLKTVMRALDIITTAGANEIDLDIFQKIILLLKALVVLISFFMCFRSLILFYGVLLNIKRMNNTAAMLAGVASSAAVDGPQGVGKTRTQIYTGMLAAENKLPKLLYKYYLDCPVENELEGAKKTRFLNRKKAVEFYFSDKPGANMETNENDRIPLLYSNIQVHYDGRTPYELKREHFTMDERLYESNVKILSETDNILPNTMRKKAKNKKDEDRSNDVDEFVGLDRQYTDGTLLTDTHENGSIYKSIRDCQQCVYHLVKSEYTYTPSLFKFLYNKVQNRILKKEEKTTLRDRKLALFLEKLTKTIGFTKVYYVKQDGAEGVLKKNRDLEIFILPNQVPYSYDDRDLQKNYAPEERKAQREAQAKKEQEEAERKKAEKKAEKEATSDKTEKPKGKAAPDKKSA